MARGYYGAFFFANQRELKLAWHRHACQICSVHVDLDALHPVQVRKGRVGQGLRSLRGVAATGEGCSNPVADFESRRSDARMEPAAADQFSAFLVDEHIHPVS